MNNTNYLALSARSFFFAVFSDAVRIARISPQSLFMLLNSFSKRQPLAKSSLNQFFVSLASLSAI